MRNFEDVINNGFLMPEQERKLDNLALLSLHIALKSYFSTYQTMKYDMRRIIDNQGAQKIADEDHNSRYIEAYAETIVHFQHFIELICKDILRSEHELLATDAQRKPVILYQLLKGIPVDKSRLNGVHSIEFSETISRLFELIKKKCLKDTANLLFWLEYEKVLKELNTLRNRIWHRGSYVLRYYALDCFMGMKILPLTLKIIEYLETERLEGYWKYAELDCGLDPIKLIIEEFSSGNYVYNIGKIALAKELGRAAYQNPLSLKIFDNKYEIRSYESRSTAELKNSNIAEVKKCPVCGINSLLVYDDIEEESSEHNPEEIETVYRYTWQVHCVCCSFEINYHLNNPNDYGIPLENYWAGEKL